MVRALSFILIVTILLTGCGESSSSPVTPSPKETVPDPDRRTTVQNISIKIDGEVIAYVIGFYFDRISLYIASKDRYVDVQISSGEYYESPFVYYEEPNCTGEAVTYFPAGEIGKTITYFRGKYFLATEAGPTPSFTYRSYLKNTGECTNMGSAYEIATNATAYFEETSRPYDFESISPIAISFD